MGGGPDTLHDNILVVLPIPEPAGILDGLREKFPHVTITYYDQRKPDGKALPSTEIDPAIYKDKTILVTLSALPPTPESCPKLSLIHFFSAGIDKLTHHPLYTSTDITLTTSSGIHGPQIAEWVVMTALVHSHKYNQLYELQKQNRWGKLSMDTDYHKVRDMVGQRLGVLGYGSIGRQVARVGKAMGMDVVAYTASPKDTPEKRRDNGFIVPGTGDPEGEIPSAWFSGTSKESLDHFLKQEIDVLLISVPLTKQTTHLLSAREFAHLSTSSPRGPAFIANISRGPIIDQPALVDALHIGFIRGAALDVTDPEPLPPDDPLWDAPNVIITPHVSGVGVSYTERAFQVLEMNLGRRGRGERLVNVVDRGRGY
ncbi:2-hydroxyacid dehydrogenase [Aulographum hederae CBS 113979]|uniref:2-hydroxyacid dehydrogenase n=1 Tax=Aulographum hederae CBS 113979 TaxID=1176131 RepID=A0A6G1H8X7_9PEZI|nr:2-hydroxyacid dehydrogenase [Aulographum hederae CBS 113979]